MTTVVKGTLLLKAKLAIPVLVAGFRTVLGNRYNGEVGPCSDRMLTCARIVNKCNILPGHTLCLGTQADAADGISEALENF